MTINKALIIISVVLGACLLFLMVLFVNKKRKMTIAENSVTQTGAQPATANSSEQAPEVAKKAPTVKGETDEFVIVITGKGINKSDTRMLAQAGQEISWVNDETMPVTLTMTDNLFPPANIKPGATFKFTFTAPGMHEYTIPEIQFRGGVSVIPKVKP